jgi:putative hemolysin
VLPPLIRGYLRLGAFIGDGAVIDREFGTTDVLVILPLSAIEKRYFDHFELSRRAA